MRNEKELVEKIFNFLCDEKIDKQSALCASIQLYAGMAATTEDRVKTIDEAIDFLSDVKKSMKRDSKIMNFFK